MPTVIARYGEVISGACNAPRMIWLLYHTILRHAPVRHVPSCPCNKRVQLLNSEGAVPEAQRKAMQGLGGRPRIKGA